MKKKIATPKFNLPKETKFKGEASSKMKMPKAPTKESLKTIIKKK